MKRQAAGVPFSVAGVAGWLACRGLRLSVVCRRAGSLFRQLSEIPFLFAAPSPFPSLFLLCFSHTTRCPGSQLLRGQPRTGACAPRRARPSCPSCCHSPRARRPHRKQPARRAARSNRRRACATRTWCVAGPWHAPTSLSLLLLLLQSLFFCFPLPRTKRLLTILLCPCSPLLLLTPAWLARGPRSAAQPLFSLLSHLAQQHSTRLPWRFGCLALGALRARHGTAHPRRRSAARRGLAGSCERRTGRRALPASHGGRRARRWRRLAQRTCAPAPHGP